MVEVLVAFFVGIAAIEVASDIGSSTYNYVEPKVTQGVDYVKDKLDSEEQEQCMFLYSQHTWWVRSQQ